jgi:acetolactate synthase small subunit
VDVAPHSLTLEITGSEDNVQGIIDLLCEFGKLEVVRSGKIAISRDRKAPRKNHR